MHKRILDLFKHLRWSVFIAKGENNLDIFLIFPFPIAKRETAEITVRNYQTITNCNYEKQQIFMMRISGQTFRVTIKITLKNYLLIFIN